MTQGKNPTLQSKDSEDIVLGSMFTDTHSLKVGCELLEDDDFYFRENQIVFKTIRNAYKLGNEVDTHLICEELKRQGKLKQLPGGAGYLTGLSQKAGTSANVEAYCAEIRNYAVKRGVIELAKSIADDASSNKLEPLALIEQAKKKLKILGKRNIVETGSAVGDIISGASARDSRALIDKLRKRKAHYKEHGKPFLTGIPTGFIDLDEKTTILEPMNLVVIAGRPAMGKTALALNIADNVCRGQGRPTGFISLEMSKEQLCERLLSIHTKVSGEKIKRGTIEDNEMPKLESSLEQIESMPMFILDNGCSTIAQVVYSARRLKDKHNIELLIIDYLQLLSVDGGSDSRQYEVAEISRRLKQLAMELHIPIIAVAQLSRKVEERTDKRPLMSDLRDSGQIEQDADVAVFVYRRDYYNATDKPGQAEVLVRKNRNGDEAEVSLAFDKGSGKFSNLQAIEDLQSKNPFG